MVIHAYIYPKCVFGEGVGVFLPEIHRISNRHSIKVDSILKYWAKVVLVKIILICKNKTAGAVV